MPRQCSVSHSNTDAVGVTAGWPLGQTTASSLSARPGASRLRGSLSCNRDLPSACSVLDPETHAVTGRPGLPPGAERRWADTTDR